MRSVAQLPTCSRRAARIELMCLKRCWARRMVVGAAVVLGACATTPQASTTTNPEDRFAEASEAAPAKHADSEPAPETGTAPATQAPSAPRTCDLFERPGLLKRVAVVRLLDAGLPRWLAGVEGDRALANRRFQGWLVKSIYPDDPCYKDLDLRAGDVVQKVNGKSIEKPEQAFDVAESLRSAPSLTVDYLRDGKPRRLSIDISRE
jgi:hypothetical protein